MTTGALDDTAQRLLHEHGELMGGQVLRKCLGYRAARAFQIAALAGRLPVPTFELPGRRGRYAKTVDVARWLDSLGQTADEATP